MKPSSQMNLKHKLLLRKNIRDENEHSANFIYQALY